MNLRLGASLMRAREAALARISPEENGIQDWLYERREFRKLLRQYAAHNESLAAYFEGLPK